MARNIPGRIIKDLPFNPEKAELGRAIGNGQDNIVYPLLEPAEQPHLRVPLGWVAKIGHEPIGVDKVTFPSEKKLEIAKKGIAYKKNKYEILKHFLGDYIPDSSFVLTSGKHSTRERYVELTLQRRVPQNTLADLMPEQTEDPRLRTNLLELLGRLQYMYRVLGEANARSSQKSHLDAKLDLGGISDAVRAERLDHVFGEPEVEAILRTNKSPNLLVNPDTMQLYCIDFDQGQWNEGMSDTKQLAFDIDRINKFQPVMREIGAHAIKAANKPT